jgi:hypothetical protein
MFFLFQGRVKVIAGETEESMASQPQHAHVKEAFHVLVEFEGIFPLPCVCARVPSACNMLLIECSLCVYL